MAEAVDADGCHRPDKLQSLALTYLEAFPTADMLREATESGVRQLVCHFQPPSSLFSSWLDPERDQLVMTDSAAQELAAFSQLELTAEHATLQLPETFGEALAPLQSLSLSGLSLQPGEAERLLCLTRLTRLRLKRCGQLRPWLPTVLLPRLCELRCLQTLNLYGNELRSLPPSLATLPALTALNVGDNQLRFLPAELARCTSLTSLKLAHNELTALPHSFHQLTSLRLLDLMDNALLTLPAAIAELVALERLRLTDNQLKQLPTGVGRLPSLLELAVASNPLATLPRSFIHLAPRLLLLDLADTALRPPTCMQSLCGQEQIVPAVRSILAQAEADAQLARKQAAASSSPSLAPPPSAELPLLSSAASQPACSALHDWLFSLALLPALRPLRDICGAATLAELALLEEGELAALKLEEEELARLSRAAAVLRYGLRVGGPYRWLRTDDLLLTGDSTAGGRILRADWRGMDTAVQQLAADADPAAVADAAASMARAAPHAHVCQLVGLAVIHIDTLCLVTNWMARGSLRDAVVARLLSPAAVAAALAQAAAGLAHLHAEGIVHGHFHAGQLLLDSYGNVRVADYAKPTTASVADDCAAFAVCARELALGWTEEDAEGDAEAKEGEEPDAQGRRCLRAALQLLEAEEAAEHGTVSDEHLPLLLRARWALLGRRR